MAEGIEVRHRKGCRSLTGGRCSCDPSYRASVWSNADGKRIRRKFPTAAAAKEWRRDAQAAVRKGTMRAPSPTTIRQAWDAWHENAKQGNIRNRSGERYKPSAIRGYEKAMRREVLPAFGAVKLTELRVVDVQDFVDQMLARGLSASTIVTALNPLRAIYRRGLNRGEVAVNPTRGLELPAVAGRRDRIASPDEASRLIAALPAEDRPVWATAMYAGLRRGELMALEWADLDLAGGVIRVERSWDTVEGPIGLKSHAGRRRVPIAVVLRDYLDEHRLQTWGQGLAFGGTSPFIPRRLSERADEAWEAAGLDRITLHECRRSRP